MPALARLKGFVNADGGALNLQDQGEPVRGTAIEFSALCAMLNAEMGK